MAMLICRGFCQDFSLGDFSFSKVSEWKIPKYDCEYALHCDGYIYAAGANAFEIFNANGFTNTTIAGWVVLPDQNRVLEIALVGSVAYISKTNGLTLIDIALPKSPRIIGGVPLDLTGRVGTMAYAGNNLYIATGSNLLSIDVTHPGDPGPPKAVIASPCSCIFIRGDKAYVHDLSSFSIFAFPSFQLLARRSIDWPHPFGASAIDTVFGDGDNIVVAGVGLVRKYHRVAADLIIDTEKSLRLRIPFAPFYDGANAKMADDRVYVYNEFGLSIFELTPLGTLSEVYDGSSANESFGKTAARGASFDATSKTYCSWSPEAICFSQPYDGAVRFVGGTATDFSADKIIALGDAAVAAGVNSFFVLDISKRPSVSMSQQFFLPGRYYTVVTENSNLYALNMSPSYDSYRPILRRFSLKTNILEATGQLELGRTFGYKVRNGYVFAATSNGLQIFDPQMKEISRYVLAGATAFGGIEVYKDKALCFLGDGLLGVVDISSIESPKYLSTIRLNSLGYVHRLTGENLLSVGANSVDLYNLTDPIAPKLLGQYLVNQIGSFDYDTVDFLDAFDLWRVHAEVNGSVAYLYLAWSPETAWSVKFQSPLAVHGAYAFPFYFNGESGLQFSTVVTYAALHTNHIAIGKDMTIYFPLGQTLEETASISQPNWRTSSTHSPFKPSTDGTANFFRTKSE